MCLKKLVLIASALFCTSAHGQASFADPRTTTGHDANCAAPVSTGGTQSCAAAPSPPAPAHGPSSGIQVTGGSTTMVDVTLLPGNGLYLSGAASVFKYYPVVGYEAGDHQRAQALVAFDSQLDAAKFETGMAINAYFDTGYAAFYANSTAYAAKAYVMAGGNEYQALSPCMSAATGKGPSTTGSGIADGSCSFDYIGNGIVNGKMGQFVSAVAANGSGQAWAVGDDLVLQTGWHGGFAATHEIDMSNLSGADCATCQALFITGAPGPNKVQTGISIYNPSVTNFAYVNGIQITGPKLDAGDDLLLDTHAVYAIVDNGRHLAGVAFNGVYSSGYEMRGSYAVEASILRSTGTSPSLSGSCPLGSKVGGASAGSVKLTERCLASSFTLGFGVPAMPHGFACDIWDMTTPANRFSETAYTTNSVTFTGTGTSGDQLVYKCTGF